MEVSAQKAGLKPKQTLTTNDDASSSCDKTIDFDHDKYRELKKWLNLIHNILFL